MRYRPFGRSGLVVSAVSLLLDSSARHSARDWRNLVSTALDCGINGFEIAGDDPTLIEGVGEALRAVERELLFLAWRPRALAAEPSDSIDSLLTHTGLGYLDLLSFDGPPPGAEPMERMRRVGRVRAYGLTGDDEDADLLITLGAFNALTTCYSPVSGWKDRNRLKSASERDMAIIARNIWPDIMRPKTSVFKKPLLRDRANPLAGVGGYNFLENTPGWTAEDICLAYVLTEPAVTTVRLDADRVDRIIRLAEVPDRDLPTGVAAQIEMARFSVAEPGAKAARG
ncbi:MAG: hypothetical protein Q8L66_00170 [Caulobacter sp.]|nr:hypothetical protein [Caulobacter sp.]